MRAPTSMEQSTGMGSFTGMMEQAMSASSALMTSQARASTLGAMGATTMETGKATRCTARARLPGLMEGSMRENSRMTVRKAMEY